MKYPRLHKVLSNEGLSNKEIRIAELISIGSSNEEIGNQLFMDEHSVMQHIGLIYSKMNVTSRAQLIVWCLPFMYGN